LPDLLAWWRKARVKGVVIGGVAVAFRGRPRITRDVDAIVFLEEERWAEFLAIGEKLAFHERIPDLLEFAKRSRVLTVRHEKTGTPVDLSLGSLAIERQTLERAEKVKIGRLAVPVASAEDLIILKTVAGRPQDVIDMDSVLDRTPNLDVTYVRLQIAEIAQTLDAPDIGAQFERLLERKTLTGRRGKKRRSLRHKKRLPKI
jgi:predicted nucleotidyltransferase